MIAVIRIKGKVGIERRMNETLNRLNLRKKYSCIVFENPTELEMGMIERVKDLVAFGQLNKETYEKMTKLRGGKKIFRLHPPTKGIEAKKHFGVGKGVLGDNKEKINELIMRML